MQHIYITDQHLQSAQREKRPEVDILRIREQNDLYGFCRALLSECRLSPGHGNDEATVGLNTSHPSQFIPPCAHTNTRTQTHTHTRTHARTHSQGSLCTWEEAGVLSIAVAYIIFFANEFVLVYDVELLAGGELLIAHHAGEAVEVKHFAPGPPDQVVWRDALRATAALGAKPPAGEEGGQGYYYHKICIYIIFVSQINPFGLKKRANHPQVRFGDKAEIVGRHYPPFVEHRRWLTFSFTVFV